MSDQLQMTDGMHIIVEALKQNNIDTIYGVVGILLDGYGTPCPCGKAFVILVFVMSSRCYAAAASAFTQNRSA